MKKWLISLETFHFNYDIWEKSVLQHFVHFKLPYWGPSSNPLRVKIFFHFLLHNSLQIVITIHIYSKQNDVRIMYQELFQFQNLQSSLQYCVAYDCINSYYRGFQASSKKWILTENWKINCKKILLPDQDSNPQLKFWYGSLRCTKCWST